MHPFQSEAELVNRGENGREETSRENNMSLRGISDRLRENVAQIGRQQLHPRRSSFFGVVPYSRCHTQGPLLQTARCSSIPTFLLFCSVVRKEEFQIEKILSFMSW